MSREKLKTRYKYIQFVELPKKPLDILWQCLNNRSKEPLGVITFYKPWKQHVIQFNDGCVFNNQCLKDIADFLEQLNKRPK